MSYRSPQHQKGPETRSPDGVEAARMSTYTNGARKLRESILVIAPEIAEEERRVEQQARAQLSQQAREEVTQHEVEPPLTPLTPVIVDPRQAAAQEAAQQAVIEAFDEAA